MSAGSPRQTCFVCLKPRSTCVCASIVPIDNRTGVFVLQHPKERGHPIGTARFVELGLRNSEVVVAANAARDLCAPIDVPPRTGLLFPRADARDLEEVPAAERPEHLVVLDGTWAQARALYRRNPWLQSLPHYQLSPASPSRYRIRKEPSPEYVSTIESVLLALTALEPGIEGIPGLLTAFDRMIDVQVGYATRSAETGTGKRFKRSRRVREFRGVPRWLGEGYDHLIGVYAEALPVDDTAEPGPRHLLQLTAVRLSTGELYERMVVPREGLPGDEALGEVGLETSDFDGALAPDDLAEDFEAFTGEGQAFVAWNGATPSLMHDTTGLAHRLRLLNAVLRGLGPTHAEALAAAGPSPSLDRVIEVTAGADPGVMDGSPTGAVVPPLPLRGRAGARLANLITMTRWIRERGRIAASSTSNARATTT